jgi:hypothetical protein
MNPQCARCGKVVYPTEKVNCLDKVSEGHRASPSCGPRGCTCSEKFWHLGWQGMSGSVFACVLAQGQGARGKTTRPRVADHAG